MKCNILRYRNSRGFAALVGLVSLWFCFLAGLTVEAADSVTVSKTGPVLDENDSAAVETLKVKLASQPPAGQVVVIDLASDTVLGAALSSHQFTFTNANWNVFQSVTVTVIDDAIVELPRHTTNITLTVNATLTTFNVYDSVAIVPSKVTINDNDTPVSVFRTGLVLDEGNAAITQVLNVRVNTQPPAGQVVVIDLGLDTALGVAASQSSFTFDHANWLVFQTATISAVNDAVVELPRHTTDLTLAVNPAATTFDSFDSVAIPNQKVSVYDNDASVSVFRTGPALYEGDLAATQLLNVRINTQPPAGQVVVIDLGSDTAQGVTLSVPSLTFNNATWNVFQKVTITTVDDAVLELPKHNTNLTLTINQPATTFNSFDSITIANQSVTILDDEYTLAVTPATRAFSVPQGASAVSGPAFAITRIGYGTSAWTITSNKPWLTVDSPVGTTTTETDTVTIKANSTALSLGNHAATLTITDPGASNPPCTVNVTVTVVVAATIGCDPLQLSFSGGVSGPNPPPKTVNLTNIGSAGTTLNWTATPTQPWLQVVPFGGTTTTETDVLSVSAIATQNEMWMSPISPLNQPSTRFDHSAVWTGKELLIWGGAPGVPPNNSLNTGGRYNPVTNSWTAMSTVNAPYSREGHSAIWTGSKMIIWGGHHNWTGTYVPGDRLNDGAAYDPELDQWLGPISSVNAPSARTAHTAVWTGTEMIVWGGNVGDYFETRTGKRYNPATNTWAAAGVTTTNAPSGRAFHCAVWTGSKMAVWGGLEWTTTTYGLASGGLYDPTTNTWTNISTVNAPAPAYAQSSAWTGAEMIVFDGWNQFGGTYTVGGRYNPATNSWSAMLATPDPSIVQYRMPSVWTGKEMITWRNGYGGHRYQPPIALAPGTYTSTLLITDPQATNNPQAVAVTLTVAPPLCVTALDPAPGATVTLSPSQIILDFNQDLDAASVLPQTLTLVRSGGDGTFTDGNEVAILPDGVSVTGPRQATVNLSSITLTPDTYRVTAFAGNSAQGALGLDGIDDRVVIPNNTTLNPAAALTLECWVRVGAGGDGTPRLISKGTDSYELYTVGIAANRRFGFRVGTQTLTTTNTYAIGSWVHVAATFDATSMILYVNGVQAAIATPTVSLVTNTKALTFGRSAGNAANFLDGLLDEVRIWNQVRSQAQIQAGMNRNLTGSEAGLVGYWQFNELSGQTVTDVTSNGNTGTLGGTTATDAEDPIRITLSGNSLKGVLDVNGNPLDGEYSGTLPSGNGTPGGDFQATFTQQ